MNITIEWTDDDGAYIVRQDGEFIGDFQSLEKAATFALAVCALNLECSGVELIAVKPK